jgi:hypothetical protein
MYEPRLIMHALLFVHVPLPLLIHATQIWEQKAQWQGFVICVKRTAPTSYPVLLQLPPHIMDLALQQLEPQHWQGLAAYASAKDKQVVLFGETRKVLGKYVDRALQQEKEKKEAAAAAAAAAAAEAAAAAAAAAAAEAAAGAADDGVSEGGAGEPVEQQQQEQQQEGGGDAQQDVNGMAASDPAATAVEGGGEAAAQHPQQEPVPEQGAGDEDEDFVVDFDD